MDSARSHYLSYYFAREKKQFGLSSHLRLIPLTQVHLYIVSEAKAVECLTSGIWGRWRAGARLRSFKEDSQTRRVARRFCSRGAGQRASFVRVAGNGAPSP